MSRRAWVAVAACAVLGAVWPWPAHAAPVLKSSAVYSWSTPNVDPGHLNDDMVARIKALPAGGRLDVVLYSDNQPAMTDAVLAAADRGVRVRLLTSHAKPDGEDDGLPLWGEVDRLVKGLRARHQTVVVGWGSLSRSGHAGIEHRKLVLTDDGRGHQWVISDSGNWTGATDRSAFNDRLAVQDRCLYTGELAHLDILARDRDIKTSKGAVVSTCDHVRTLYNLPEAKTDPVLTWLQHATCGRGALVQDSTFYLTAGDKKTPRGSGTKWADQLIRLHVSGATVQVATNDAKWSASIRTRLVKAGVTVYDVNGAVLYDHRKAFSASDCKGGPFGAQGSTTRNATAYDKNGNQIMTTTDSGDVHAMQSAFYAMRKGAGA